MAFRLLGGLTIGLVISWFILANSHSLPFLIYVFLFFYGIGITFGLEKMKAWMARVCGVAVSVDYWVLICLFFRRNGLIWGIVLYLLLMGLIFTVAFWYGIILFFISLFSRKKEEAPKNLPYIKAWAVVVVAAMIVLPWYYWPQMSQKGHAIQTVNHNVSTPTMPLKNMDAWRYMLGRWKGSYIAEGINF